MKTTRLLGGLSDIMTILFYVVCIFNICVTIFDHDWTRGIFYLLSINLMQKVCED